MDFFRATTKNRDGLQQDSEAAPDSKREKVKAFGQMLKRGVATGAQAASSAMTAAAQGAHDQVLLLKLGTAASIEAQSAAAAVDTTKARVRLNLLAAADLQEQTVGEMDAYCMITVGKQGNPWGVKIANAPFVKLPVELRRQHPRWNVAYVLQLPTDFTAGNCELTLRVMDAHATRPDTVCGEARVLLSKESSGARTLRLQAGGFASLSMRWRVYAVGEVDDGAPLAPPTDLQELDAHRSWSEVLDSNTFEGAWAFWNQFWSPTRDETRMTEGVRLLAKSILECDKEASLPTQDSMLAKIPNESVSALGPSPWSASPVPFTPTERRKLAHVRSADDATSSKGADGVNELLLQAPLSTIFSAAEEDVALFLEAINLRMGMLRPLARSRIAVAMEKFLRARRTTDLLRDRAEMLLLALFTTASGTALQEVKQLIDTAGTGNDMLSLLKTLTIEGCHAALLAHFREDAAKLGIRQAHVLSDIDMTVWVGVFGSGGPKFPQGPIPGAISLYEMLGGRITFLSARPPVWESKTRGALLNDIGIAEATVLQGTLKNVMMALVNKEEAHKGMGEQKEVAFLEFADLHPDARFIFFGDSGEGDVDFARNFMKSAIHGRRRLPDRAALIHDVVAADGEVPKTGPEERIRLAEEGVCVFDTYIGAALHLFRLGLLTSEELARTARIIIEEFEAIPEKDFAMSNIYYARKAEFSRDNMLVYQALKENELQSAEDFLADSPSAGCKESVSSMARPPAAAGAGGLAVAGAANRCEWPPPLTLPPERPGDPLSAGRVAISPSRGASPSAAAAAAGAAPAAAGAVGTPPAAAAAARLDPLFADVCIRSVSAPAGASPAAAAVALTSPSAAAAERPDPLFADVLCGAGGTSPTATAAVAAVASSRSPAAAAARPTSLFDGVLDGSRGAAVASTGAPAAAAATAADASPAAAAPAESRAAAALFADVPSTVGGSPTAAPAPPPGSPAAAGSSPATAGSAPLKPLPASLRRCTDDEPDLVKW